MWQGKFAGQDGRSCHSACMPSICPLTCLPWFWSEKCHHHEEIIQRNAYLILILTLTVILGELLSDLFVFVFLCVTGPLCLYACLSVCICLCMPVSQCNPVDLVFACYITLKSLAKTEMELKVSYIVFIHFPLFHTYTCSVLALITIHGLKRLRRHEIKLK